VDDAYSLDKPREIVALYDASLKVDDSIPVRINAGCSSPRPS
jgi:hypothetical protein